MYANAVHELNVWIDRFGEVSYAIPHTCRSVRISAALPFENAQREVKDVFEKDLIQVRELLSDNWDLYVKVFIDGIDGIGAMTFAPASGIVWACETVEIDNLVIVRET